MRYFLFLVLIMSGLNSFGQDGNVKKEILDYACECIGKIALSLESKAKNDSIKSCIESATMLDQVKTSLLAVTEKKESGSVTDTASRKIVIDMSKDYKQIEKQLLQSCQALKKLLMENNQEFKHDVSENKKALKYYSEGQRYSAEGQYDKAVAAYKQAIQEDGQFAYAWDNLGMSYRKLDQYEKAIDAYNSSLKINPQAIFPIQNKAIAYEFLKKYDKALENYLLMIDFYPDNPEGYFGAARMDLVLKNYERGLNNIFKCYLLYAESKSPYIHDAESVVQFYYDTLKAEGKLDILKKAAEKNKINLNEK